MYTGPQSYGHSNGPSYGPTYNLPLSSQTSRYCPKCKANRFVDLAEKCVECGTYVPRSNQASSGSNNSSKSDGLSMRNRLNLASLGISSSSFIDSESKAKSSSKKKKKKQVSQATKGWSPEPLKSTSSYGQGTSSSAPLSFGLGGQMFAPQPAHAQQPYYPQPYNHQPYAQPSYQNQQVSPQYPSQGLMYPQNMYQAANPPPYQQSYPQPPSQYYQPQYQPQQRPVERGVLYGSGPCACDPICRKGEGCFGPIPAFDDLKFR